MNKTLTIAIVGIMGAFIVGLLSANPVVEAVGGWQAVVADHEARIAAIENGGFTIVETQRISTSQTIPAGQRVLVQTSPCNSDEFIHGFGFVQQIAGTSLGAEAQPIDTIFLTPRPDGGKLAVRVANTLDKDFNLNLDVFCGKIMPVS